MSLPGPGIARLLSGACLLASLLSGCAQQTMMAPASAPPAEAKPALATPPASIMTPQGY